MNGARYMLDLVRVVVLCGWLDRHQDIIVARGVIWHEAGEDPVRRVVTQCDRCGREEK